METLTWSKIDDKWAYILVLREQVLYRLKIFGISLTLKSKVQGILDAIQRGQSPLELGGKSTEVLDVKSIDKAEVSPGNSSLTLHGSGESAKKITFATADSNADEILKSVLARTGRTFQPTQEEIGVFEAILPPGLVALVGGLLWMGLNQAANDFAEGKKVEIKGGRRQATQRALVGLAETLGTGGTTAVGIGLLVLVIGWTAMRLLRRPQRTVWRAESA